MYLAQYYMHVYVNPVLFHLARATASDPCLGVRVGAAYIFDLHTGFQIFLIVEFFFMVTRCSLLGTDPRLGLKKKFDRINRTHGRTHWSNWRIGRG